MAVTLRTGAEKRAAADWLAANAPGVLADLKMFADAFGPMVCVTLKLDEGEAALADVVRGAQRAEGDECD